MILLDPAARPIIAHRGASGEFPENTLLAFERGLAQGADALEFDVRITADGVPVVIHDSAVDRTTDGTGAVGDWALDGLMQLDAGSGQRIPTVAQTLGAFPDVPAIIEVKEAKAADPLAETIRRHGAQSRVLVGSFDHRALGPFVGPEFRRAASRRETALCWLAARLRWGLTGLRHSAFTVPVRHSGITVVDRSFVAAATKVGKPVHVWTVNDRREAERLRTLGVTGIITDFPQCMRDLCAGSQPSDT
ncbi:MAG: hypothetical protein AMS18_13650 [Gemmatimonas sp. SG8_17]|nr:MAG: hypothetical protein AMS18_13650 [Gemmatimonas sp. SG8_17]